MDAVKLYHKYTLEQLHEMDKKLREDPQNINPDYISGKSIHIYNKKTEKKFDAISWAITYHLRDLRVSRNEPINESGYTGK